ncbi:CfaE/CblD family pilus tip adhesin [Burkholderia diffusa]|uniref:CfaE/CblD family pilus tip adhesin n=1 Tax=Burkholderia diffusa TaxID=488732 RepID=UPI002653CD58|nr:CfaE/CblD family pilus tip adhesin [Burkholderia diffusa]MDN7907508.1 CfaE/CblD family pilus tip adhesin [Burkholderia diffusa]
MTQINRIRGRRLALAAALAMFVLDASAVRVAPADRNDTVQVTRDRGTPMGDVVIFNGASGGYDTADSLKWASNSWTCTSSTNTQTGACATAPDGSEKAPSSVIRLLFTEEKTGATAVLNLAGAIAGTRHRDCNGNIIPTVVSPIRFAIHSAQITSDSCNGKISSDGRVLFVGISAEELKRLPSGGIWKANLRLNERQWGFFVSPTVAVFRAAITLNTTDKDNIQVYLPEFASAAPTVDLKLRSLENGRRMAGTSTVDMCLYDGYNSQSTWFDVSASDGLTIDGRVTGRYSVLLDADKSGGAASRVDYNVSLSYAGQKITLPNNETVRLQGVNNSGGRLVSLPGIPASVVCTPTPLTLETPEFAVNSKRPGKYSSKLTISFTPSSASL